MIEAELKAADMLELIEVEFMEAKLKASESFDFKAIEYAFVVPVWLIIELVVEIPIEAEPKVESTIEFETEISEPVTVDVAEIRSVFTAPVEYDEFDVELMYAETRSFNDKEARDLIEDIELLKSLIFEDVPELIPVGLLVIIELIVPDSLSRLTVVDKASFVEEALIEFNLALMLDWALFILELTSIWLIVDDFALLEIEEIFDDDDFEIGRSPGPLNQPLTESKIDQSSSEVDFNLALGIDFSVGGTTMTNEG